MYKGKNVAFILLMAGKGKRLDDKEKKQYIRLNNRPMFLYSLDIAEKNEYIDLIDCVIAEGEEKKFESIVGNKEYEKLKYVTRGGEERYDSVINALRDLKMGPEDIVLIHDSARPMINDEIIENVLDAVIETGAAILGVKVKDTIKITENGFIKETPKRDELYQAQTPQGFLYGIIRNSYESYMKERNINNSKITDDAEALEKYYDRKIKIKLAEGSYKNIKVTTKEDIGQAEGFLASVSE